MYTVPDPSAYGRQTDPIHTGHIRMVCPDQYSHLSYRLNGQQPGGIRTDCVDHSSGGGLVQRCEAPIVRSIHIGTIRDRRVHAFGVVQPASCDQSLTGGHVVGVSTHHTTHNNATPSR